LVRKFTSAEELSILDQTGTSSALLTRIWCAKEAVSKALGKGLALDFRSISLTKAPSRGRWTARTTGSKGIFDIRLWKRNDHMIALCQERDR